MTPAQQRQEYEEKRNKLARELLPATLQAAVARYPGSPISDVDAQAVADAFAVANLFLARVDKPPAHEAQIAEALKYLRDPERCYENRVSCAISTLTDKPYEEQDWRAWQYNKVTTIERFMVRDTKDATRWLSGASRTEYSVSAQWSSFEHAAHWTSEATAHEYAQRFGGRVVPAKIVIQQEPTP